MLRSAGVSLAVLLAAMTRGGAVRSAELSPYDGPSRVGVDVSSLTGKEARSPAKTGFSVKPHVGFF